MSVTTELSTTENGFVLNINLGDTRFSDLILSYENNFFDLKHCENDILYREKDVFSIDPKKCFFGSTNDLNTIIKNDDTTKIVASYLDPVMKNDGVIYLSDLVIHNWLNSGNSKYRKQAFERYGNLIGIVIHKMINSLCRPYGMQRIFEKFLNIKDKSLLKNHENLVLVREIEHFKYLDWLTSWVEMQIASYSIWENDELGTPLGYALDSGRNPADVIHFCTRHFYLPHISQTEKDWLARKMHNNSPIFQGFNRNTALLFEDFGRVYSFICEFSDAKTLQAINFPAFVRISILSHIEFPCGYTYYTEHNLIDYARLLKSFIKTNNHPLSNNHPHRNFTIDIGISDFINDALLFADQNGMKIPEYLPVLSDYGRLKNTSERWHKDIAPFMELEQKYVWEYDSIPINCSIDGDTFTCTPLTSSVQLMSEGVEMKGAPTEPLLFFQSQAPKEAL